MSLTLKIAASDPYSSDNLLWDYTNERFIITPETTITLEHSLLSLQKWEQEHEKPFLSVEDITQEEELDYIRCMTVTKNVDPNVYYSITDDQKREIAEYINKKKSAVMYSDIKDQQEGKGYKKETITSNLIYYWMTALTIPFEPCNRWHLNYLLSLIKTCSEKSQPPKKQSRAEAGNAWRAQKARLAAARAKKPHV